MDCLTLLNLFQVIRGENNNNNHSNKEKSASENSSLISSTAREAAVACIFRICTNGNLNNIFDNLEENKNGLASSNKNSYKIDILLIKRSIRNGDPWSGDFAFPGGHLERNEDDLDAVKRETLEEIGIDLNHTDFHWIGRLPKCSLNTTKSKYNITPHIFVLFHNSEDIHDDSQHQIVPNKSEVEYSFWVDLMELYKIYGDSIIDFIHIDIIQKYVNKLRRKSKMQYYFTVFFMKFLGIKSIILPSICLRSSQLAGNRDGMRIMNETIPPLHIGHNNSMIWGLTYAIIRDIFKLYDSELKNDGNNCISHISRSPTQRMMYDEIRFDNSTVNYMIVFLKKIIAQLSVKETFNLTNRTLFMWSVCTCVIDSDVFVIIQSLVV
eukprot:gene7377-10048_t